MMHTLYIVVTLGIYVEIYVNWHQFRKSYLWYVCTHDLYFQYFNVYLLIPIFMRSWLDIEAYDVCRYIQTPNLNFVKDVAVSVNDHDGHRYLIVCDSI
jgi:hypothetical protein